MGRRRCCCKPGCNFLTDCLPPGITDIGLTIPSGSFAQQFCTNCGDLSDDYVLTRASPTSIYWNYYAEKFCRCQNPAYEETEWWEDHSDCGWLDLSIAATINCAPATGRCGVDLEIRVIDYVAFGTPSFYQFWRYAYDGFAAGLHGYFPPPPTEWDMINTGSANVGTVPCDLPFQFWPPMAFWPYDIETYPETLTLEAIIPP